MSGAVFTSCYLLGVKLWWAAGRIQGNLPWCERARDTDGSDGYGRCYGHKQQRRHAPCSYASWYPRSSRTSHYDARWNLGIDPTNNWMLWPSFYNGRNWGDWWNPSCIHRVHWIIRRKRVPEKRLLLLYWLCQSLWLCTFEKDSSQVFEKGISGS